MYLLDTNHCSYLMEGRADVIAALQAKGPVPVATSVIARGELVFMARHSEQATANTARVQAFLNMIRLYNIDTETADIYGELKAAVFAQFGPTDKSQRRRTRIEQLGVTDNDLWFAATTLRHGLILVSSDRDFVRLQQVRPFGLENWLTPTP